MLKAVRKAAEQAVLCHKKGLTPFLTMTDAAAQII